MRRILVTLDGSTHSEAILPVVEDLALKTKATLVLFRSAPAPVATAETPASVGPAVMGTGYSGSHDSHAETRSQAIERRKAELVEFLDEKAVALRRQGLDVEIAHAFGDDPADLIVEYACAEAVDLIALATHWHTGLRSLVSHSVAGKVLASGVRPVLLVTPRGMDTGRAF